MSDQLLRGWLAAAEQTGKSPNFRVYPKVQKRDRYGTPLKTRITHEPNDAMRVLHDKMIAWLGSTMPHMPHAVGGVKGISPRQGLTRHGNNRYGYRVDIHDAYNAVDINELTAILWRLVQGQSLHGLLTKTSPRTVQMDMLDEYSEFARFVTDHFANRRGNGIGVAYGAPASVVLFNLYVHVKLDQQLGAWCRQRGMTMTRYIDDILITCPCPISRGQRSEIRDIIDGAGLVRSQGAPRKKEFFFDLTKTSVTAIGMDLHLNQHGVRVRMRPEEAAKLRWALKRGIKNPRKADHQWIASRISMLKSSLPPGYKAIEARWAKSGRSRRHMSPEQLERYRWQQFEAEAILTLDKSRRDLYLMRSEIELLQLWHQYRGRRRRSLRAMRQ